MVEFKYWPIDDIIINKQMYRVGLNVLVGNIAQYEDYFSGCAHILICSSVFNIDVDTPSCKLSYIEFLRLKNI